MNIKLWDLINDENDMPKLHVIKEMEYELDGPELVHPYDTILLLCKISKMHRSHMENVYLATYNHFGDLIGFFHIATGHMDKVESSSRIKATCILLSGGYSYEIFHNHPVDDQQPSDGDKTSSLLEKALAAYLEVDYLTDYVVTKGGWTDVNTEEEYRFNESELAFINEEV